MLEGDRMNPRREAIKRLEEGGYKLKRNGSSHDIYYKVETKITIPVKRHDFNESDLRYILKEAGLKQAPPNGALIENIPQGGECFEGDLYRGSMGAGRWKRVLC